MSRSYHQSGNLLIVLSLGILLAVVAITTFLVLKQTGFVNRAADNSKLDNQSLSAGLLAISATDQTKELLKSSSSVLASTRKKTLLALIEKNPRAFLQVAIPKTVKEKLPEGQKPNIEDEVALDGVISVVYGDDFKNKTTTTNYFLRTDKKHYRLFFPSDELENITTGTKVKVTGYRLDDYVVAKSSSQINSQATSDNTASQFSGTDKVEKRLAVIMINFISDPVTPWTSDQVTNWMFHDVYSLAAYYKETSFGRWEITGKVFGWYTLNTSKDPCNYYSWGETAKSLAAADGFVDSEYTNVLFAFGPYLNCGAGGWAEINGRHSWIFGDQNLHYPYYPDSDFYRQNAIPIHELGHNFGADHANSLNCVDDNGRQISFGPVCQGGEYGDPFEVMGTDARQMNNFHKGRLGMLNRRDTVTITKSGVYDITPIEKDTDKKEALRIPVIFKLGEGPDYSYYLEYRQPTGVFDSFLPDAPAVNGVILRLATSYNYPRAYPSYLIDTHPVAPFTFQDAPLKLNETFLDRQNGVKIKVLALNKRRAQVEVTLSEPKCVRRKPSLQLYPVGQWGRAGSQLTYHLSIKNNNSTACGETKFTLTPTLFSGWTQSLDRPNPVPIASGAYGHINISVRSSETSPVGTYTFTESVTQAGDSKSNSSINANFNIYNVDTEVPVVSIIQPASDGEILSGESYIAAQATDNFGVSSVTFFINNQPFYTTLTGSPTFYAPLVTTNYPNNQPYLIRAEAYDLDNNRGVSADRRVIIRN